MHDHLLADLGKAVVGAALLGLPAYFLKVPLLLAYLLAGVILGPHLGLGQIQSAESISTLSHIGLVLLMFILGLEIDIRKLLQAGKAVLVNGITQFAGCMLLALAFFSAFGNTEAFGKYGLLYLCIAASLSSTLIVVKILSDRMELGALTSRITLGILVLQDLWAITFLAIQPNLANLNATVLGVSLGKAAVLVISSWLFAKYVLPKVFRAAGKQPELMLILALGWCFAVCGLAATLNMSLEMGALVAGVSIAAFPYHVDVAAKVSSLRDFFITLFFVSLGLQIPMPTKEVLLGAGLVTIFVFFSRIPTIFPVLHMMKYGNRASLLPGLNLSQLSEFSLVLAALGVSYGHVKPELVSAFVISMVVSSLISSVLIPKGHNIYHLINPLLEKIGFKDHVSETDSTSGGHSETYDVVLLGFFTNASSLLHEMHSRYSPQAREKILVVDFNPEAHHKLKNLGIHCKYGDIGHIDTLKHLNLSDAKLLICTIPDHLLKGTSNLKLVYQLKSLAPNAKIIVTAEQIDLARDMYKAGADYVFIPRIVSANYLADVIERIQSTGAGAIKENAVHFLETRNEVLP